MKILISTLACVFLMSCKKDDDSVEWKDNVDSFTISIESNYEIEIRQANGKNLWIWSESENSFYSIGGIVLPTSIVKSYKIGVDQIKVTAKSQVGATSDTIFLATPGQIVHLKKVFKDPSVPGKYPWTE